MKLCFICETPFQVLNSLNYIAHQNEFPDAQVDFYLGRKFYDCENMAQRLRSLDGIHRVYTYAMGPANISSKAKLKATLLPKYYIADCVDGVFDVKTLDYDYVHFSFFGPMPYAMVYANKKAKVRYFEDGIGTYLNNIVTDPFTTPRKILYRLTGTDYTRLHKPDALFVNNKAMFHQESSCPVKEFAPLAKAEDAFLKQLFYVFDYQPNQIYADRQCVYLSRPNDGSNPQIDLVDKKAEAVLAQFSDQFVLRMHPRQKDLRVGTMAPDLSRSSWELMCIDEITEDHVLVGEFSTAQVLPKFIFDKEPWIIFFYPIYREDFSVSQTAVDKMVEDLRNSYRKPEKVVTVYQLEDLGAAVQKVQENAALESSKG